jgi:hypothetical protein
MSTPTYTHTSQLPEGVSAEAVVKTLHDHDTYIKIACPQLVSYEFDSGSKEIGQQAIYRVTDKKPLGQTTYTLTITNLADGVDTLVNAKPPVGTLTIAGKWRLADGSLIEEVEIDGNMIMKKMVKGNVEKTHPEQHEKLLEHAKTV